MSVLLWSQPKLKVLVVSEDLFADFRLRLHSLVGCSSNLKTYLQQQTLFFLLSWKLGAEFIKRAI